MNKSVVFGLCLFVVTEVLCVVALFSSDWLVSNHISKCSTSDQCVLRGVVPQVEKNNYGRAMLTKIAANKTLSIQ